MIEAYGKRGAYLCHDCIPQHPEYEQTIAAKEGYCEICGRYRLLLTFCVYVGQETVDEKQLELFS